MQAAVIRMFLNNFHQGIRISLQFALAGILYLPYYGTFYFKIGRCMPTLREMNFLR